MEAMEEALARCPRSNNRLRVVIRLLTCLYLVLLLVAWFSLRLAGESFWPVTMLLFGPRWLMAVPLVLLVPLAAWFDRAVLPFLAGAAMVVFIPIMGLNLALSNPARPADGTTLRVLSYNIHGGLFNVEEFSALLNDAAIDVVALQECPEDLRLPLPKGWQIVRKRGLAVLSRYPIHAATPLEVLQPGDQWPGTYLLHTVIQKPEGDMAVCSLHLPSPRFGLQTLLDKRTLVRPDRDGLLKKQLAGREFVAQRIQEYLATLKLPLVVAGDFNSPVESSLYRRYFGGYENVFSATARGYGYTQRVSVSGLPFGSRIDHILTGNGAGPVACKVGPDLGSDHLPVIADIGWMTSR